jgi:hypothetical protein
MTPKPTLTQDSAGGYYLHLYGAEIGHLSKVGRIWHATLGEQDLGHHNTRREAVEAMMDVYTT